jgi:hypothetical protein
MEKEAKDMKTISDEKHPLTEILGMLNTKQVKRNSLKYHVCI